MLLPFTPTLNSVLLLDGARPESVDVFKYLGVHLDRRLSFTHHADLSAKKAIKAIGAYSRNFGKVAPSFVFEKIYHVCIVPAMMYGIESWWPRAKYAQSNVEKVQRLALRKFTNNYTWTISYVDLMKRANDIGQRSWTPLWQKAVSQRLILLHKYWYNLRYFPREYLIQPDPNVRRSVRLRAHNLCLELPHSSTLHTSSTFLYFTADLWNSLENDIVHSKPEIFKNFTVSYEFVHLLESRYGLLLL